MSTTNSRNCGSSSTDKGTKKQVENMVETKFEEFHKPLADTKTESGGLGAQEGEIVEIKQRIIVLERRIEQSQTVLMAHVHQEQLMISLLCYMFTS
jgi:hypothetical protein